MQRAGLMRLCAAVGAAVLCGAARGTGPARLSVAPVMKERAAGETPLTFKVDEVRAADALAYWAGLALENVEPLWRGGAHKEGLDPDRLVTLALEGRPMEVLEGILGALDDGAGGGVTWQPTRTGAIQVGPRARLNAFRTVRVYDIADLLGEAPHFTGSLPIGLDSASSLDPIPVFTAGDIRPRVGAVPEEVRGDDLIALIVFSVEPDQWVDNGGTAATIRRRGPSLVVHAPGYVHRALNRR